MNAPTSTHAPLYVPTGHRPVGTKVGKRAFPLDSNDSLKAALYGPPINGDDPIDNRDVGPFDFYTSAIDGDHSHSLKYTGIGTLGAIRTLSLLVRSQLHVPSCCEGRTSLVPPPGFEPGHQAPEACALIR